MPVRLVTAVLVALLALGGTTAAADTRDTDWMRDPAVLSDLRTRLHLGGSEDPDGLAHLAPELAKSTATAFGALGLDYGTRLDDSDLIAAKERLGLPVGRRFDAPDIVEIISRAHARIEAALLLLGVPYGTRVDPPDLHRAAARIGHDVGADIGAGDIHRLVTAGLGRLHMHTRGSVSDGLAYSRWTIDLPGGTAVAHRLRWHLSDPRVGVRTVPTGRFGQRAPVTTAVRGRADTGAVAAVNGGFWQGAGDPDGLLITGGRLVSEPGHGPSWLLGARAAFGLGDDGYVVARASGGAELTAPGSGAMRVQGVDRPVKRDDVVLYTSSYGASTRAPRGTVEMPVTGVPVRPRGTWHGRAGTGSLSGNSGIPDDGLVIAATGRYRDQLSRMVAGSRVTFNIDVTPFGGVREAIAGGPMLLTERLATDRRQWVSEGFGASHNDRRHPRTAVGFTDDGWAMAVVVDGRQPGYSVGMTTMEMSAVMRAFGAVDALMLDGGGSSQMAIGERLANRPCCDRGARPVATSIVLHRRP